MKYLKTKKYRKFFRDLERLKHQRLALKRFMEVQADELIRQALAKQRLENRMREAELFCCQFQAGL